MPPHERKRPRESYETTGEENRLPAKVQKLPGISFRLFLKKSVSFRKFSGSSPHQTSITLFIYRRVFSVRRQKYENPSSIGMEGRENRQSSLKFRLRPWLDEARGDSGFAGFSSGTPASIYKRKIFPVSAGKLIFAPISTSRLPSGPWKPNAKRAMRRQPGNSTNLTQTI